MDMALFYDFMVQCLVIGVIGGSLIYGLTRRTGGGNGQK